jgi:hypothetical protein
MAWPTGRPAFDEDGDVKVQPSVRIEVELGAE